MLEACSTCTDKALIDNDATENVKRLHDFCDIVAFAASWEFVTVGLHGLKLLCAIVYVCYF